MSEIRRALRGRFVRQQVCTSKSVADLIEASGLWAGLVFERVLLWQDDEHRFCAEAQVVKARCLPWHDVPLEDVARWLKAMDERALVVLYTVAGVTYGWFPGGARHQPKQKADRFTAPCFDGKMFSSRTLA